jgi:hypothetical protein
MEVARFQLLHLQGSIHEPTPNLPHLLGQFQLIPAAAQLVEDLTASLRSGEGGFSKLCLCAFLILALLLS